MRQADDKPEISRRMFLQSAVTAGTCMAVAATAPGLAAAGEAQDTINKKKNEGYQLTQHVVDYYKSAAS